jgi:entry exclusion lipoprotein TrbK
MTCVRAILLMILKEEELMSSKNLVFIIALSATLTSCGGGDGAPEINSTNCSGGGMQSILPTFKTEAERQAFIDKCQSMAEKK